MNKLMRVLFACVAVAIAFPLLAAEGVEGTTVRPVQITAKIEGCKIAKSGDITVNVGDLIELDYTYASVPTTIPMKVDHKLTTNGAVAKSQLGFRNVTTPKGQGIGTGTIAFFFEAKKEGDDTVTLIIDGAEYVYKFKVAKK